MKYQFGNRLNGKSSFQMIQLKLNLEKGFNCSVATQSPEKIKRDFEYMTGAQLHLNEMDRRKDVYVATLINKSN